MLKCFFDIVDDRLGSRPVHPSDVLADREESAFTAEQIGYLARPIDIPGWLRTIQNRYAFLADLDEQERRWARANPADRWDALQAVEALTRPRSRRGQRRSPGNRTC